jgi:alpha-tubulin suppressor-like RCC1 family protein
VQVLGVGGSGYLSGIVAIYATGFAHMVALKNDGTVYTWGYNNNGQLGDNTLISKSSPIQTISAGTNWKQVSVGYTNMGAIKS